MAESCALSVRIERGNGSLLVKFKGEIDLSTAGQLHDVLEQGLPTELDMEAVTFMDSVGLRELVVAHHAGCTPRIVRPSAAVSRVLELRARTGIR